MNGKEEATLVLGSLCCFGQGCTQASSKLCVDFLDPLCHLSFLLVILTLGAQLLGVLKDILHAVVQQDAEINIWGLESLDGSGI